MGQLIPGDAYMVVTRGLVISIWAVTPLSWIALLLRSSYLLGLHLELLNEDACDPFRKYPALKHLYPSSHPLLSSALFIYCGIEAAFSIYHAHLKRKIQSPGPRPLYGRRFLRGVFAKALESGLSEAPDPSASASGRYSLRSLTNQNGHANGNGHRNTTQADANGDSQMRQRLGRLRAASFVPAFVERPLEAHDPRAIKFQETQAKWFFGAPFEHITRRDVQQWLSWSLFATTLEELEQEREEGITSAAVSPLPPSVATFASADTLLEEDVKGTRAAVGEWDPTTGDRLKFLEYCMELLEARQGKPYPTRSPAWEDHHEEHTSPRIRMMRLTIDPVRVSGRPLASYILTNTLSALTISKAVRGGFERRREGRLPYLLRTPRDWDAKTSKVQPLIMLHGLGIGLAQYSSLIDFFNKSKLFKNRPVLILLQPNISQNIFSTDFLQPFGHHETTSAFRRIIEREGWNESGVAVLSHSYGSLVHSWLIKSLGDMVKRSCFVDPVCFQLWVPFVCGNFLYKRVETPIELLMRYFVGRELGTANTLCRYFDWSSNILWPDEVSFLCFRRSNQVL